MTLTYEDLKPCPFCGNKTPKMKEHSYPLIINSGRDKGKSCGWWVWCDKCGANTGSSFCTTYEKAVKKWNKRIKK